MQQLECLTRDGCSAAGKPGVLVSMHPADRYLYFDKLVQDILSAYDCAVFFDANPNDDMPADLAEVKLIVIAVTEKYLTWKHSGFISEFQVADQSGIPVLPIMLEQGINNLFNTRCGKRQFVDDTAKLCHHLQSVLSTEEPETAKEAAKSVFISYRKQDIEAVKRLVAIIRSERLYDHIRLWYDTNLAPGENYSRAIMDALHSCDLYVLVVTPALLEQDNYVMREEYPVAKKERKTILPIEMQKTDRAQLAKAYQNLPKCITEKQTDALFAKLAMLL